MISARPIKTGILATILTGTISTILGGIVLNCLEHRSSPPCPARPATEEKSTELVVTPPIPKPQLVEQPAVSPVNPSAPQPLLGQLAAQREEIDVLKREISNLKCDMNSRKDCRTNPRAENVSPLKSLLKQAADARPEVLPPAPERKQEVPPQRLNPPPQPKLVFLYYRVPSQRTRQIEDARIDEVTNCLQSLNLSYTRGREWKDRGLGPLWVPIAIHRTSSWRSYGAKTVAHRDRIIDKMSALGIETRIEKPEEIDD